MLKSNISNQLHQHINGFLDHCRSRCFRKELSRATAATYDSLLRGLTTMRLNTRLPIFRQLVLKLS